MRFTVDINDPEDCKRMNRVIDSLRPGKGLVEVDIDLIKNPTRLVSVIFMSDEISQARYGKYAERSYYLTDIIDIKKGDNVLCETDYGYTEAGVVSSINPNNHIARGKILCRLDNNIHTTKKKPIIDDDKIEELMQDNLRMKRQLMENKNDFDRIKDELSQSKTHVGLALVIASKTRSL
jgi:hypothetical protein